MPEQADLVLRGRCRAIVRVPWDDHLAEPEAERRIRGSLAPADGQARLAQGMSAPLYPLQVGLIKQLVEAASAQMDEQEAVTLQVLARQRPEAVVEIVPQRPGR